ncbi:hypothetical protein ACFQ1Q_03965 [Winogradskyella litorisediminis]|uniref:Adhesin domain-containing protein n=1 Tax=Winogradskyella litorisediminis TaxID=1156618 RepID=A0ABW3N7F8_9FLAO
MKLNTTTKPWNIIFKAFLYFLIAAFSFSVNAQNIAKNIFSANGISGVYINGEQIFDISVETSSRNNIEIASISDGEYGNEFSVISEVKGNQLIIALKRTVLYDTPDDKRNAHKVISASLEIKMPQNLNLSIKSDVGSVDAKGNFNDLKMDLAQGNCKVLGISKSAEIKTANGNIRVVTKNAIIETDSKSGLVDIPNNMFGFNVWKLTTVSGNITVKKAE